MVRRGKLVSLADASDELGVPYSSLHDQVKANRLTAIKIGRRLWLKRADLEAALDEWSAPEL